MPFTRAIVRPPGRNFAEGITTAAMGAPDIDLALEQHATYCAALESCGLTLTRLPADERLPDSTFVEDAAIVTPRGAMLTRPGAPTRLAEATAIRPVLEKFFPNPAEIRPPRTLDGGDVCEADGKFFIGVSARTDETGARQLAAWLSGLGYTSEIIDIREKPGLLHLKSALSWIAPGHLLVTSALATEPAFRNWTIHKVPPGEDYASNAIRVNDTLIITDGHPDVAAIARETGCRVVALDVSEFRKMDGGLSCLSLRW